MISDIVWKLLELELTLFLWVKTLYILVIPTTRIQLISNQSLQFSMANKILFVNYLEELDIIMIHLFFEVLILSHQVLDEIWNNLIHFLVMSQLNHHNSGTVKPQKFV